MRPYVEAFRLSMRRAWSTPGAIALSGLFYVLIMVVFAALWHVATSANHGFVAGYDYQALLWYLMATEAAVMAVPARRIEQIGDAIGDGTVETELLRPTLVLGIRLASELGEGSVQLLACWVFGTIVTYSFVGLPHNVAVVPLAFMSSVLAMVSNFVAVHAFAAVAFWLRDAKATWFLYQKLVFLPGGMLLPLQFLPHWLMTASWILPFWTMAYAPGRLMAGDVEPWLIVGQLAWIVAGVVVASAIFARGEKRLVAGR